VRDSSPSLSLSLSLLFLLLLLLSSSSIAILKREELKEERRFERKNSKKSPALLYSCYEVEVLPELLNPCFAVTLPFSADMRVRLTDARTCALFFFTHCHTSSEEHSTCAFTIFVYDFCSMMRVCNEVFCCTRRLNTRTRQREKKKREKNRRQKKGKKIIQKKKFIFSTSLLNRREQNTFVVVEENARE